MKEVESVRCPHVNKNHMAAGRSDNQDVKGIHNNCMTAKVQVRECYYKLIDDDTFSHQWKMQKFRFVEKW